jgi:hypothetical protein
VERGDPAAPRTPPLTSKGSSQPAATSTTMWLGRVLVAGSHSHEHDVGRSSSSRQPTMRPRDYLSCSWIFFQAPLLNIRPWFLDDLTSKACRGHPARHACPRLTSKTQHERPPPPPRSPNICPATNICVLVFIVVLFVGTLAPRDHGGPRSRWNHYRSSAA